jgi:hypothetical protein
MNKLTLVVDERELSTLRAALLLLQEQIDALREDLAEMIGQHRPAITASEIERLSLRLDTQTNLTRDYPDQECPQVERIVRVERFPAAVAIRNSA